MSDDEFLDKFFNSTGDDLDNLIKSYINQKDDNSKPFDVDMVDIQKILEDDIPMEKYTNISFDSSNDCFKTIYEQLTNKNPNINKHFDKNVIVSLVIKSILIAIGLGICLCVILIVSQYILESSPTIKGVINDVLYL